jgi:hypothetical protein
MNLRRLPQLQQLVLCTGSSCRSLLMEVLHRHPRLTPIPEAQAVGVLIASYPQESESLLLAYSLDGSRQVRMKTVCLDGRTTLGGVMYVVATLHTALTCWRTLRAYFGSASSELTLMILASIIKLRSRTRSSAPRCSSHKKRIRATTTATMDVDDRKRPATVQVWFELYTGTTGNNVVTPVGGPRKVYLTETSDIEDLTEAVKQKCAKALRDVDAGDLQVYPAGTWVLVGDSMDPGEVIPTGTSSKSALVVVARAQQPPQHQQVDGLMQHAAQRAMANARAFVTSIMEDYVDNEGNDGI